MVALAGPARASPAQDAVLDNGGLKVRLITRGPW
jgi:hypothetical protein